MANVKHTHTANCQRCGRKQAVNPATGLVAKHGYRVKGFGFFMGTCTGSDERPMQVERVITDRTYTQLREYATECEARALRLETGEVLRMQFSRSVKDEAGKYSWSTKTISVHRSEATEYEIRTQTEASIVSDRQEARHARGFADDLVALCDEVHGTPMYPVVQTASQMIKVGTVLNMWGKQVTVVEIKEMPASGCGPYMNGNWMPHAVWVNESGKRVAQPLRLIRKSAIVQ